MEKYLRKLRMEALSSLLKNCILFPFWALVGLAVIFQNTGTVLDEGALSQEMYFPCAGIT